MATRIATSGDTLLAHNISIGDMIIDTSASSGVYLRYDLGLDPATGLPYTGTTDINADDDRMLASLDSGKTIHLSGGTYNSIRIYLGKLSGITLTNTGGQCHLLDTDNASNNYPSFQLLGGSNIKVSGKYVSGSTGDPNYLGHDDGYAFSQGKYGILIDRNGLPGDQAITVEGDDKGMNYATGDSRYFYYVAPAHYEMEYLEAGWGGFTIFDIKYTAGFQERYDDFKIHDCYLHDGGSEGCYNGGNSIQSFAAVLTNFEWYNNRIIRMGTEGMQWGMLGTGCKIYNNVVVMSALQWKNDEFAFGNNTQAFQDGMLQIDVFDGDVEIYNNYLIGGGGSIIRMNGTLSGYTDNNDSVVVGALKMYNNLFMGTRGGTFLYIGQNTPVITTHLTLEVTDNYFGDLDNLYAEVGEAGTGAYAITNNNDDNTIIMTGNTYDTSMTFYSEESTNTGITNSGNTQGTVNRPVFRNWGLDTNHDYRNMEEWASVYGDYLPSGGSNIQYVTGDYVYHNRKIYKALNTNEADPPPSANWLLKIFGSGTLNLGINQSGSIYTVDYDYTTYSTSSESNIAPVITDVIISGTTNLGDTLSAITYSDILSPYNLSKYTYQWYRMTNQRSESGSAISGATGSTYMILTGDTEDSGRYFACEVVAIQDGGNNPNSEPYLSRLTDKSDIYVTIPLSYNPASTIRPVDASGTYESDGSVTNQGSLGGTIVAHSLSNIPELVTTGATDYFHVDAYGNDEAFEMDGSGYTRPVVIWVKFKLNQLPNNSNIIGFGNTLRIAVLATDDYQIQDPTKATASQGSGTDLVVCKFVFSGNTSRVIENNSYDSGILAAGSGSNSLDLTYAIGMRADFAADKSDMNLYEMYLYDNWDDGDDTDMWNYFGY